MRWILAGGGTGGHLYPLLATARRIREDRPGDEVLFFITERPFDRRELDVAGWRYQAFPSVRTPTALRHVEEGLLRGLPSLLRARRVAARFAPDRVVGGGGFGALPGLAAGLGRVPIGLLEQNRVAGRVTRLGSGAARAVFSAWPVLDGLSAAAGAKVCWSGNPLRAEATPWDRVAARRELGLGEERVLLVIGGSLGAARFSELAPRAAAHVGEVHVLHLAGGLPRGPIEAAYRDAGVPARVLGYLREMGLVYGAADAAVSRAGGTATAELLAAGLPAVLVPLARSIGHHQLANARAAEDGGAAFRIDESAGPAALGDALARILGDAACRRRMSEAAHRLVRPDPAGRIVREMVGWRS